MPFCSGKAGMLGDPKIRARELRVMAELWRREATTLSNQEERERQVQAAKALEEEADRLEAEVTEPG